MSYIAVALRARTLWVFLGLWMGLNVNAQVSPATYVTVVAQRGDGIYNLLNRYGLRTPCNEAYFYELNKLRKGQYLREGRTYSLPLFRYTYNGRSIRSTTGVDDYEWALTIQDYNDAMQQRGVREQGFRDDRDLWVPYSRLYCQEETLPILEAPIMASASTRAAGTASVDQPLRGTYPIFGENYQRVPLISKELSGKVYYLVSGHGGADPGAVGRYARKDLCEDEYAYDVTLRLAWNLLSHGATVYLITRDNDDGIRSGAILPCDKDELCWGDVPIPAGQKERLMQRSDAVNRLYKKNKSRGVPYQRLIVIHVDSDSKHERIDMYFYHKIDDPRSEEFARHMHETVRQKYREYRKGRGYTGTVSSRDLHMLRETEATATFIELGNIRNPNDQARLVIESNRQLVANWLLDGLLRDAR